MIISLSIIHTCYNIKYIAYYNLLKYIKCTNYIIIYNFLVFANN